MQNITNLILVGIFGALLFVCGYLEKIEFNVELIAKESVQTRQTLQSINADFKENAI